MHYKAPNPGIIVYFNGERQGTVFECDDEEGWVKRWVLDSKGKPERTSHPREDGGVDFVMVTETLYGKVEVKPRE